MVGAEVPAVCGKNVRAHPSAVANRIAASAAGDPRRQNPQANAAPTLEAEAGDRDVAGEVPPFQPRIVQPDHHQRERDRAADNGGEHHAFGVEERNRRPAVAAGTPYPCPRPSLPATLTNVTPVPPRWRRITWPPRLLLLSAGLDVPLDRDEGEPVFPDSKIPMWSGEAVQFPVETDEVTRDR